MNQLLLSLDEKLTSGWLFSDSILFYLMLYAILCVFIIFLFIKILPKRYLKTTEGKSQYFGIFFFFLSISIAFPILGIIYSFITLFLIKKQSLSEKEPQIKSITYPDFKQEKFEFGRKYSEGGAFELATNRRVGTKLRIQSLVNLNDSHNKLTSLINKTLIEEKTDDIRLYAYILTEKKRNKINTDIEKLKNLKKSTKDPIKLSRINKWLAESYWELIYFDLLDDVSLAQIKSIIISLAQEALTIRPYTKLYKILAILTLKQHDYALAKSYLSKISSEPHSNYIVTPYLIEINYIEKKWGSLREQLATQENVSDHILLNEINKFWSHKNEQ